jgi:hypothetical protein
MALLPVQQVSKHGWHRIHHFNNETENASCLFVISYFRHDVDEICALLGYYASSNGNPLQTFRDNISVPSSRVKKSKKKGPLDLEDVIDTLSRNVDKELPFDAGQYPRRAQTSSFLLSER